jgi:hypothetical protein
MAPVFAVIDVNDSDGNENPKTFFDEGHYKRSEEV